MADWRTAENPATVAGYQSKEHHIFMCVYHFMRHELEDILKDPEWEAITYSMTHQKPYTCDRLGCELTYWKWPLTAEEGVVCLDIE